MIQINSLKLPCGHSKEELEEKICKQLKISRSHLKSWKILRQSIDARKKPELFFVYLIEAEVDNERTIVKKLHNPSIVIASGQTYTFPKEGVLQQKHRPVIIGTGPAGLFCGYLLAQHGYRPILLERGADVDNRSKKVEHFWETGELDEKTNVSFGEGGAGTFSDGKLNTLVKDKLMRNRKVLEIFVEHGAPEEILYQQKPHIGTDVLKNVIVSMRKSILEYGGEVRFDSCMTDLDVRDGALAGIWVNQTEYIACETLVLATGHSARDTFKMLFEKSCVPMEPKPFSVGARIEHHAETIDRAQYGDFAGDPALGAADYKLNVHLENGRGVYTFCMCPGGYVVGAASETGSVVTNGMSEYARDGQNSNAALLVGITPEDFGSAHPLAGIAFQRKIERAAFEAGGGAYSAPCQRVGDLLENRVTTALNGSVQPTYRPGVVPGDLRAVLPDYICDSMAEGIRRMGRRLKGFDDPDALLTAPETRSSSPVRILRNETRECPTVRGLFPCGEGAGYAGGITSAAVDGLRCAEEILKQSL